VTNDATTDVLIAYVTAPPDQAEPLARSIVEGRRAACVNLIPGVRSVYRWQGEVETDEETLLVVKVTAGGLDALVRYVEEHHPYETPEVIAMPVTGGASAYLAWVAENVDERPRMA
jgi:periplasmic divalent cation tolerance protein